MRQLHVLTTCLCVITFVQISSCVVSNTRCRLTRTKSSYDFVVGILSPRSGVSPLLEWVERYSRIMGQESMEVRDCFSTPNYVTITVEDMLRIPSRGWTNIKDGIMEAIIGQAQSKMKVGLSVVIGPFYMNLAMILEDQGIPYLVTDYMGFDWSDISRVGDHVQWRTLVEIRPPMSEFNKAIVDYFVFRGWESAVVIMPEHPNQECQNLAGQMVENNISPIAYSLRYGNQSEMRKNAAEVLRNVKLLEQEQIIICSPRDEKHHLISVVLDEAALFNMLNDEDYSFFIMDPTTHLEPLSEINMYRKRLFTAKCELLAYRYKDLHNDTKFYSNSYAQGATDAARIIRQAKAMFVLSDFPSTDEFSKEEFLKSIKKAHIMNAETGDIDFNATGARINYTLSLYNHGGFGLHTKVGSWTPTAGSPLERFTSVEKNENDTESQETRGIFQSVTKVVVVIEEPFVMKRNTTGTDLPESEKYEGFTIDLLNRLCKDLQFKYKLVVSPENAYGQADKDGNWNGMVGEILAGNVTLGMGAISITSLRERAIDFSLGVLSTGVNILVKKPKEKFNMFQFLEPFSLELWMAIIGSSVGVSIVYFILDFSNKMNRQFTIRSTLWFSIGTLLMKGSDFSPRPTSQRILTTGFLFFVLIIVSTYTANMAAFLTKQNLEEPIDSFQQLANSEDVGILTVENSATMKFLESSPEASIYHKIWEKIKKNDGLVPNATIGRQKVEAGGYAFIFDSLINSFSEKKYCETRSVSAPILLQEHGIAMFAGAAFKSQLNIELLRLKEQGFIQELRKKWWENTRECDIDFQAGRSFGQVEFELKHTAGVFIVGVFGLGCSLMFFVFKKFYLMTRSDHVPVPKNNGSEPPLEKAPEVKDPLIYGLGAGEGKQSTV